MLDTSHIEFVIRNLKQAIKAVTDLPTENFDFKNFVNNKEGSVTTYCTIGLCCTIPYFQAQGLELKGKDVWINGERFVLYTKGPCDYIFGPNSFLKLFIGRWAGKWDESILKENPDISDKELALKRLNLQISFVISLQERGLENGQEIN